jgi:hypothetical protein
MRKWLAVRGPWLIFVAANMFLAFVCGSIFTLAEISPSNYLRDAYLAGTALYSKLTQYHDPLATDLWEPARTPKKGVTILNRQKAYAGLTLYTSGSEPKALLIDMAGRIAHEWRRPFSTVWDTSAAVRNPVPDNQTYLDKAHVFPNGDLLAIYIGAGDSPFGYGMVKLDRDSRVIWKNLDHFHHDFVIARDGKIYGLTHDYRPELPEGVDHFTKPVLDDYLVILSSTGETLKKISLLDAVNKSVYRRLLWMTPGFSLGDPLHTNTVKVLDEKTANQFKVKVPQAASGQVLLSFRELAGGSLALLDVEQMNIVWAMRGSWISQHDPDILPNGNILFFDNRGHFGSGGQSRVIEVDPETGRIVWQYVGDNNSKLESMIRSSQERLPNGNTLINESDAGRLLEVTPSGEIVWEFINPDRGGKGETLVAVVSSGQRIDPTGLNEDFRNKLEEKLKAIEMDTQ